MTEEQKPIKEEDGPPREEIPATDMCPHCCTQVRNFPYIEGVVNPQIGRVWLECPSCGVVFVPKSTRDMKREAHKSGIVKAMPQIWKPGDPT